MCALSFYNNNIIFCVSLFVLASRAKSEDQQECILICMFRMLAYFP